MLYKYRILVAHFSVRFRLWRISLEVTTPRQPKGNRKDACQFEWLSSKMRLYREQTRLTRSDNAPTTEKQSQRRLSVRVALIEDEAVPRTDKPSLEDAFVPRIDFTEKNRKSASVLFL
jgi:hypothetical protein